MKDCLSGERGRECLISAMSPWGASIILSATVDCSSNVADGMAAIIERTVVGNARSQMFAKIASEQPTPPIRRISDSN